MTIDHTDPDVLKRLYNEERLSLNEIGELAGVSQPTISYHFDKHGIDRKTAGEVVREIASSKPAVFRTDARGYERWYSSEGSKGQVCVGVSRLLAVCENGFSAVEEKHVHHKNKIPWDNRPDNIEIVEESKHIRDHNQGEKSSSSKLSEESVCDIKERAESGDETYSEIADDYGVTKSAVYSIKTGKTWSHLFD